MLAMVSQVLTKLMRPVVSCLWYKVNSDSMQFYFPTNKLEKTKRSARAHMRVQGQLALSELLKS